MNYKIPRKKLYFLLGGVLIAALIFGLTWNNKIDILNSGAALTAKNDQKSTLAGIECENASSRPFAVMMSSDAEARPLSGIGEADMVFEMPVVDTGFTRMMAVYQCNRPQELGSIRSSRMDFVPLALGLDAIYAHFGGEKEVLEELNSGIIDNIDGLKYDGVIYYRKTSIPRPHNAFTSFDLLEEISEKLGYELNESAADYPHEPTSRKASTDAKALADKSEGQENGPPPIFNKEFQVVWTYDKNSNSYLRSRSNRPEIDKNTNSQVQTKNVVIMETDWTPINKDYIRVTTVGSGPVTVYKNGEVVRGTWKKETDKSKLYFYGEDGKEIKFAPGSVWIEIITEQQTQSSKFKFQINVKIQTGLNQIKTRSRS